MKLSEAIRIGASWSKQIRQNFKTEEGTCTLGAALEGYSGEIEKTSTIAVMDFKRPEFQKLKKDFPYMLHQVPHPISRIKSALYVVMFMLNDNNGWTREQIADWVEKLENQNGWTGTKDIKEKEIKHETVHN